MMTVKEALLENDTVTTTVEDEVVEHNHDTIALGMWPPQGIEWIEMDPQGYLNLQACPMRDPQRLKLQCHAGGFWMAKPEHIQKLAMSLRSFAGMVDIIVQVDPTMDPQRFMAIFLPTLVLPFVTNNSETFTVESFQQPNVIHLGRQHDGSKLTIAFMEHPDIIPSRIRQWDPLLQTIMGMHTLGQVSYLSLPTRTLSVQGLLSSSSTLQNLTVTGPGGNQVTVPAEFWRQLSSHPSKKRRKLEVPPKSPLLPLENLQVLCLEKQQLDPMAWWTMCQWLAANQTVQDLRLKYCRVVVVAALPSSPPPQEEVTHEDPWDPLVDVLVRNRSLRKLFLDVKWQTPASNGSSSSIQIKRGDSFSTAWIAKVVGALYQNLSLQHWKITNKPLPQSIQDRLMMNYCGLNALASKAPRIVDTDAYCGPKISSVSRQELLTAILAALDPQLEQTTFEPPSFHLQYTPLNGLFVLFQDNPKLIDFFVPTN
ncbi:expressed unknown protein [Seminavis robusta]|uniref:Uncharacterized protein n=1 Tax=Seminavis robusta TaxID=568900 RepID=A0A9N8DE88_9STRA|nr:expressed unknown protein [Seminavis robusta]|eukprot:Sro114_g056410.1 n/a (481) ;mRNA; f:58756-60198